jgi:ketosteroid isomerase-like protein
VTTQASQIDVLLQLETQVEEAASGGDLAALESLLADDFMYTHSTGNSQTRGEWLESLTPLVGQRRRVPSAIRVELHDDIAVVSADLDIVWVSREPALNRYVRVWRNRNGAWQAISQRTVPAYDRKA